jgi:hypothetical protein
MCCVELAMADTFDGATAVLGDGSQTHNGA